MGVIWFLLRCLFLVRSLTNTSSSFQRYVSLFQPLSQWGRSPENAGRPQPHFSIVPTDQEPGQGYRYVYLYTARVHVSNGTRSQVSNCITSQKGRLLRLFCVITNQKKVQILDYWMMTHELYQAFFSLSPHPTTVKEECLIAV